MHSDFFANFSMRARLFALLILVLIIGIPAGIYWYFFTKNTASITVNVVSGENIHIKIAGTLDNENLPLADRLLEFEKDCGEVCVFSPVAPIRYTLTLTSPGKSIIQEDVIVGVGEDKTISYTLQDDIIITPLDVPILWSRQIWEVMVANATKKDKDYAYKLIAVDAKNTVYVERSSPSLRELWILSLDKFTSLYRVPDGVGTFQIDMTGQYFIAPLFTDKTLILSLDTKLQREVPLVDVLAYVWWEDSKVLSESWVVLGHHSSYGYNPRFTDWLDISPSLRLWYIDKDDTQKLSLSNLPSGQSVLISLNRMTGDYHVIKRWVDIEFLFYHDGNPVFLDNQGSVWKLEI